MREAMPLIRAVPGFEDIVLASAGRKRDWSAQDDLAEAAGLTRYLGSVQHADMLALMRGSRATLILSDKEAISRAALEAIWVGADVVLPDIKEFAQDCSELICSNVTPEQVCSIVTSLDRRQKPKFNFELHSSALYEPIYRGLLENDEE